MKTTVFPVIMVVLAAAPAWADVHGVADSPHNLATVGAARKPASEQQICITCHTPHAPAPAVTPLWDPQAKPPRPKAFSAASDAALPGQPTGASKICLSCHDGMISAGNIVSRNQAIQSAERMTTLPGGRARIGTDLSDDHPISFRFDERRAARDPTLKPPHALTSPVQLDRNGEMQCTSCHDPHDNSNSKFLVSAIDRSQLCNSCHQVGPTTVPDHVNCLGCHQNHTAPSGKQLLRKATITGTCLICHGGQSTKPQGPDISAELKRLAIHDTSPEIDVASHAPADVACTDCHEPHTMRVATASAPMIRPNFGKQAGVRATGTPVNPARFEYEVCFKCHGDKQDLDPRIPRVIRQRNLRLKLSTSAISFHPVEGRGINTYVPSLRTGMTPASLIYCTDCHSADTGRKAGGTGANGPHGSDVPGLLVERYDTSDYTAESAQAFALCYRCHERSSILSDRSFKLHQVHIVKSKTPCSACHDPHGIASAQGTPQHSAHLINFDVRIAMKSSNGKLEYNSTGLRTGNCSLNCHGTDHTNFPY